MAVVRDFTALPAYNWNFILGEPQPTGRPVILAYSFPDVVYPSLDEWVGSAIANTFSSFVESERAVIRAELAYMADQFGVTLVEVSGDRGDIRFSFVDFSLFSEAVYQNAGGISHVNQFAPFFRASNGDITPQGEQYWSTRGTALDLFGDIIVNSNFRHIPNAADWLIGIAQHEGGHSLGLKHPFDVVPTNDKTLATDLDHWSNTVMSYTYDVAAHAHGLGPLDIEALQYIYGPPLADGTQFSSWSFDRATETFTLVGFDSADQIRGTGSHDRIFAGAGDDLIYATTGDDIVVGGAGNDRSAGGLGFDLYVADYAYATTSIQHNEANQWYLTNPGAREFLWDFERIQFTDAILALDINGNAGQAYRIYQAAFDRVPDRPGLSYWVNQMDDGMSFSQVALNFILSREFRETYGAIDNMSDAQYIDIMYENVLSRDPDTSGFNYWSAELARGYPRHALLAAFADSAENQANVAAAIQNGILLDLGAFV